MNITIITWSSFQLWLYRHPDISIWYVIYVFSVCSLINYVIILFHRCSYSVARENIVTELQAKIIVWPDDIISENFCQHLSRRRGVLLCRFSVMCVMKTWFGMKIFRGSEVRFENEKFFFFLERWSLLKIWNYQKE